MPGLGEAGARPLLRQFGSLKRLRRPRSRRSPRCPGIGPTVAQAVVDALAGVRPGSGGQHGDRRDRRVAGTRLASHRGATSARRGVPARRTRLTRCGGVTDDRRHDRQASHDGERRRLELVIVTGMSGAGRSDRRAVRWRTSAGTWSTTSRRRCCRDMVDLGERTAGRGHARMAVGRRRAQPASSSTPWQAAIDELRRARHRPARAVPRGRRRGAGPPVREQSGARTRCRATAGILDGIARERALLGELRARADLVIDTVDLNVHELRRKVDAAFAGDERRRRCGPRSCPSASSTACRWTPTSSSTCGSCPTRTGCPSCAPSPGRDAAVRDYVSASEAPASSSTATPTCSSS